MNIRKVLISLVALIFTGLVATPAFAQETYKIDKYHSAVLFNLTHFDIGEFWGQFLDFEGEFKYDAKKTLNADFTIKAGSVFTNNKKRDGHLRSPDFFNVKQFPTITFKTRSSEKTKKGWKLKGDLTMLGKTKPITVTVTEVGAGKDTQGKMRRGYKTTFTIKRSQYGMKYMQGEGAGSLGDEVNVVLTAEGVKQ